MNQFPEYDVTMEETHHVHKLDAPSGTAITLAEGILDNLDRKTSWVKGTLLAPDGTLSGSTQCAPEELPISSIRRDEVPGLGRGQHHHHPRRQEPQRLRPGRRAGRRIHRAAHGPADDGRPFPLSESIRHYGIYQ